MDSEKSVQRGLIIAIDGPSGVGKSTTARMLAKRLNCQYIDTGAMYRAVALMAQQESVAIEDTAALVRLSLEMDLSFIDADGHTRIFLNGRDVTEKLRLPEAGEAASRLSSYPEVRQVLVEKQRRMGQKGNVVMEGRDIGSVVFPDADLKIFLDADHEERVRRRHLQWRKKGLEVPEEQVSRQMLKRDQRDQTREVAPLVPCDDAIMIDTTHLSPSEVIGKILSFL